MKKPSIDTVLLKAKAEREQSCPKSEEYDEWNKK